jgi:hypothetical protein
VLFGCRLPAIPVGFVKREIRRYQNKSSQMNFKDRVTRFWEWFAEVADRYHQTIDEGDCEQLTGEISEFMQQVMPRLSWAFGPGSGEGHSFTLSGEGQLPKQLLSEYWLSRAPDIPGWTFYASRQRTPIAALKEIAIELDEQEQVDVESFVLKTSVDEESQAIDIVAWHPALQNVPAEHHLNILFLLLDEALGEFGTQMWLGDIKVAPVTPDEKTKRLHELPKFIDQVNKYHGWEKLPPLESYTVYEVAEPSEFPRGDTVVGTTCIPDVVFELMEHRGQLPEDPFEGIGAEFVYVAIDGDVFPDGSESDVRGNIEDTLSDALQTQLGGRTLGGAFGTNESYIDLLLVDGQRSHATVRETLDSLQLLGRSRIVSYVEC